MKVGSRAGAVVCLVLSVLLGCTSVSTTLPIGEVKFDNDMLLPAEVRARVSVGPFGDRRTERTIAVIDGSYVYPAEDLGRLVQRAFERRLYMDSGLPITLGALSISGDVVDLRATAQRSFPVSTVNGLAKIEVNVLNAGGSVVYRASYTGEVSQSLPIVTEGSVAGTLRMAIASAVNEMFEDPRVRAMFREVAVR